MKSPEPSELYQEENTKFTVWYGFSLLQLWKTEAKTVTSKEGAKKLVPEGVEGRSYKGA